MRIWNIINDDLDCNIEISDKATLYDQRFSWYLLIRAINDFFNNRNSNTKVFEDEQPINKNDWQCIFIPFDAEVQLNKITTKSPLKDIQLSASNQLTYSPIFGELQEVWGQLDSDLEIINQKLKRWGLTTSLKSLSEKDLSNFISFHSLTENLSPLDIKQLLLNIFLDKSFDKKILFLVELPEIYATERELIQFNNLVEKAIIKGCKFIFVSNKKYGCVNYSYKNKIINDTLLEQMKFKVKKELPFYCSDSLYKKAKDILLLIVDNSINIDNLAESIPNNFGAIVTIIHVIMYNLGIGSLHEIQGLEPNLKKFISHYT